MKFFLPVVFVIAHLNIYSQETESSSPYDSFMKTFNARMDTVYWLCNYDNIAWWTSDSVYATPKEEQNLLGQEWFCIKENKTWHAFYGKYIDGTFNSVYHYKVDSLNKISRTYESFDKQLENDYARAIIKGASLINAYPDSQKVRFNQYIRRNIDSTFSVWFLPAFTTNGIAVYGGEFYYLIDKSGNNVISKIEYSIGYRGFKPDSKKEIFLDYTNFEEPPLSALFFGWYYKEYFSKITIETKKYFSAPLRKDGVFLWVHAAKDK